MNKPPIQLSLSLEEIQYILGILGAQRYADVNVLIPKIQDQAQAQLIPPPAKESKD